MNTKNFLIRIAFLFPETRSIVLPGLQKIAAMTNKNLKKKTNPSRMKFMDWVKKKDDSGGWKSPKTGKQIKFNSLPLKEQARIRDSFFKSKKRKPLRFLTKKEKQYHDKLFETHVGQHKKKLDNLQHTKHKVRGMFKINRNTEIEKTKKDLHEGIKKYIEYRTRLDRKRKIQPQKTK
jgi:hypothetical protein